MKKYINIGKKLFPICRSITGSGTYETLKIIKKEIPILKIKKKNPIQKFLTGIYHQNGTLKKHM